MGQASCPPCCRIDESTKGITPTMATKNTKNTTPTDPLLRGQLDVILPQLAAAKAAAAAAENEVKRLRAKIFELTGSKPQTVTTVWGTVTVARGQRRKKVVCPVLEARIDLLIAEGLATGATIETVGDPSLRIKAH